MKTFKEMDELIFKFGEDTKQFANKYAGTMPPAIKSQLQELMFTGFSKEIEAITEREQLEVKYKKKFYDKLLRAKMQLRKRDRADAWFDKVFEKYFSRGLLEHLLVYGALFLHRKDLFVARRLFVQINNDELLAQFTLAACEYLGWTSLNAPVEQPSTDETEADDEQQDADEKTDDKAQNDEQCTDVTVYELKEVQPAEQQQQPVVKVERTVTHEVMTATPGVTIPDAEADAELVINDDGGQATPANSDKKVPLFFRPGGKNAKNV